LEELFENLDVTGDGCLAPEELLPAFTALSDDVSVWGGGGVGGSVITCSRVKDIYMETEKETFSSKSTCSIVR
jgi:hypothetical protein